MTVGGLRLFRSLLLTGTVFVPAAGAHVLGGGTLPADAAPWAAGTSGRGGSSFGMWQGEGAAAAQGAPAV